MKKEYVISLEKQRETLAIALQTWLKQDTRNSKSELAKRIPPEILERMINGEATNIALFWKRLEIIEELTKINFYDCLVEVAKQEIEDDGKYFDKIKSLKQISCFAVLSARLKKFDQKQISMATLGQSWPTHLRNYLDLKNKPAFMTLKRLIIAWMFLNAGQEIPQMVPKRDRSGEGKKTTPKVSPKTEPKTLDKIVTINEGEGLQAYGVFMNSLKSLIGLYKMIGKARPLFKDLDRRKQLEILAELMEVFEIDQKVFEQFKSSPTQIETAADDILSDIASYTKRR